MSQKLIHIAALLNQEELKSIDNLITFDSEFIDGKHTSSMAAKKQKNNLQLGSDSENLISIQTIISKALQESPLFNIAALPKSILPITISKYDEGKYYGWHVDSPIMGNPLIRTDLAMTIFLSDPSTYEGGELVIQADGGSLSYKLPKGDAILYPCQYLHAVNQITKGVRVAAVTWIQSNVKNTEQRQILFQLNQVHGALYEQSANEDAANLLLQTHSNLFRMWADV